MLARRSRSLPVLFLAGALLLAGCSVVRVRRTLVEPANGDPGVHVWVHADASEIYPMVFFMKPIVELVGTFSVLASDDREFVAGPVGWLAGFLIPFCTTLPARSDPLPRAAYWDETHSSWESYKRYLETYVSGRGRMEPSNWRDVLAARQGAITEKPSAPPEVRMERRPEFSAEERAEESAEDAEERRQRRQERRDEEEFNRVINGLQQQNYRMQADNDARQRAMLDLAQRRGRERAEADRERRQQQIDAQREQQNARDQARTQAQRDREEQRRRDEQAGREREVQAQRERDAQAARERDAQARRTAEPKKVEEAKAGGWNVQDLKITGWGNMSWSKPARYALFDIARCNADGSEMQARGDYVRIVNDTGDDLTLTSEQLGLEDYVVAHKKTVIVPVKAETSAHNVYARVRFRDSVGDSK
jgi:multidrug efflux pump subunit AcrA (membrane-fusion protein)